MAIGALLGATLAGCGGGGDSPAATTPASASTGTSSGTLTIDDPIGWQGNAAGPWVYLSNDGIIAFTKASRQIHDCDSRVLGSMGVDTAGRIVNADGSLVGASITLAANGLGSNRGFADPVDGDDGGRADRTGRAVHEPGGADRQRPVQVAGLLEVALPVTA